LEGYGDLSGLIAAAKPDRPLIGGRPQPEERVVGGAADPQSENGRWFE